MGGTSTDVCLIENGSPQLRRESVIGDLTGMGTNGTELSLFVEVQIHKYAHRLSMFGL